ncbi:MAG: hypothetical protein O3B41_07780 [Bacteroidetes bacterium]|nr:hypothetical protein [Bacteroidota bacterium]
MEKGKAFAELEAWTKLCAGWAALWPAWVWDLAGNSCPACADSLATAVGANVAARNVIMTRIPFMPAIYDSFNQIPLIIL